ncbi:hypothetical protein ACFY36_06545 [Actinoplanes sp. NPDC000266]
MAADARMGIRLDADAQVFDAGGTGYPADQMLSLSGGPYGSTDPQLNPEWRLDPGAEVERRVFFSVPRPASRGHGLDSSALGLDGAALGRTLNPSVDKPTGLEDG